MEKQEIKRKLTKEEIASGIKGRSREQQQIPKNKIITPKNKKKEKYKKSWIESIQEIVNF